MSDKEFKYYVLCVSRNKGKLVDKYYRTSKDEILALERMIVGMYKNVSISKYRATSFVDLNNIKYFD